MFLSRWFGKKQSEGAPAPPTDLVRRLFISGGDEQALRTAIASYAEVMSRPQEMVALILGSENDWLILDMPTDLHPYYFHNLGSWLGAKHEVVTSSFSAEDHWHYALVEESEPSDYLVGLHHSGQILTVGRPAHWVLRGEDLSLPWTCAGDLLAAKNISSELASRPVADFPSPQPIPLLVEHYGNELNPGLQTSYRRRPVSTDWVG